MDKDPFEELPAKVSFSIQYSYHQIHDHLPVQLVFGRDMFMLVDVEID